MPLPDHLTYDPDSGHLATGYMEHMWDPEARKVYYTREYMAEVEAATSKRAREAAARSQEAARIESLMRICAAPGCDKKFYPIRKSTKTCGNPRCQKEYQLQRRKAVADIRECVECGITFAPRRSDHIYCGGACTKKGYLRRKKEESHAVG